MDWNSRRITALVEAALREDHALADQTTLATIGEQEEAQSELFSRYGCVLAGLGLVSKIYEVFASLQMPSGPMVFVGSQAEVFDGVRLRPGQTVAVLRGRARALLACERVLLNFLQHLSGIATLTRQFVDAVRGSGAAILDTRKTTPGLRQLEKYAVICGGGQTHRADLSDGILIKRSHVALAGGVAAALERARARRRPDQLLAVEVVSLEEMRLAVAAGAAHIMLDHVTPELARQALALAPPTVMVEVGGGLTLENIGAYVAAGIRRFSIGALTQSAPVADFGQRWRRL